MGCLVAALLNILAVRGLNQVFCTLVAGDGKPRQQSSFVRYVQATLAASGLLSHNFSSHSFHSRGSHASAGMVMHERHSSDISISLTCVQAASRSAASSHQEYLTIYWYSGISIQRTAWDNSICPLDGNVLN